MSKKDNPVELTPEEKAKAEADAKAADAKKSKKVRVILENGTLGTKLLKKGDVTDDKEYVALLETERGKTLVEAV